MKLVTPLSRARLTEKDITFISRTLGSTERGSRSVLSLLLDPETRDQILDDDELFHALLECPNCIPVSLHLYFFVMVRHALKQAGKDDIELADYIASLLSDWVSAESGAAALTHQGRSSYEYVSDLMSVMASMDHDARFHIMVYMANHFLVMTGVFPEHIRKGAQQHGRPQLGFYEEAGRWGFAHAADHRLAKQHQLQSIFVDLSKNFSSMRKVLNHVVSHHTFLNTTQSQQVLNQLASME